MYWLFHVSWSIVVVERWVERKIGLVLTISGIVQYTTISVLHGRLSILKMLRHWVITFFGNLAGKLRTHTSCISNQLTNLMDT